MPDNVKTALSMSLVRLLRPLVRIMLREGLTYYHFAGIAQMAFVESAAKDYVGPYGFPVDLPFEDSPLSITNLTNRHAAGVSPEAVLQELKRVGAVTEVGFNVWKPLKQEYIEPSLSPENLGRMASLVESLLSTLENNTRGKRDGTDLFERTMIVDAPLTSAQLLELQGYLKVVGGQFLQRVDTFAAVDLQEKMGIKPGDVADIHAGLQCFLYV